MNCTQQARGIYEICVVNAKAGKTITYREVLKYLGYKIGVPGHAIRYGLELAWIASAHTNLPRLTAIIVNDTTGEPSPSGFPVEDWNKDAQNVFNHKDWPHVDELNWEYIWQNRKKLANIHLTRGYWND